MIPNFSNRHVVALKSALLSHGATATAIIDTFEYEDVTVVVSGTLSGGTNGTNPAVSFLTSDDTVVTNAVTAVATQAMPSADGTALVFQMSKLGKRRYVRLAITAPSGSTNSNVAPLHAVAVLGRKDEGGVSTLDIANSTSSVLVVV